MARFVRISAKFRNGITYWSSAEYYEAGPGHVHVTDDHRDYADCIAPGGLMRRIRQASHSVNRLALEDRQL
jgi:hypothetical protein